MHQLKKSPHQNAISFDYSAESATHRIVGSITPEGVGPQPATAGDFIIYLRLITPGFTLKEGRTTNAQGQWGSIFPMPWVKQNCFTNCDTCFDNGNYQPIMTTGCQAAPFKLELRFQSNSDPNKWGKTVHDINPNCSFPGQVECV
jgi:hypothetical protein